MGLDVKVPMKRYAEDFVPDILHMAKHLEEEVAALRQPRWGVCDDDDILRDEIRLEERSRFLDYLNRLYNGMTEPKYESVTK